MNMLSSFAKIDTFSKSKAEVQVRTASGALLSTAGTILAIILVLSELGYYTTVRVENHLLVDTSIADRQTDVFLDIDFPALSCARAALSLEDAKGNAYPESAIHIQKIPLDRYGKPVRSMIFSTTESQDMAPGCKLKGTMNVRRHAGHFHVSANFDGRGGPLQQLIMSGFVQLNSLPDDIAFNASHVIHKLAFGQHYPKQENPLEGVSAFHADVVSHQYHLKVVPTLYEPMYSSSLDCNQYSATDFAAKLDLQQGMVVHPGVMFRFEFSPIMVRLVETRDSLLHFLTSVCAVLGGVYAITGIVDQILYRTLDSRKVK